MLLGGLTAGVGLYSLVGGKKGGEPPPPPFSTVSRPEKEAGRPEEGHDESAISHPPGAPIVVGRQIKRLLERAPERVQARMEAGKPKGEERPTGRRLPKQPLKLTYNASQIIPPGSPYESSRRILKNAETLVERQKFSEAIEVYERAKRRIDDDEIREKIDKNIADIRSYLERGEEEAAEGEEGAGEAITFPEIIVPLTMQTLAIENLSEGLKSIAETLAETIASSLEKAGPRAIRGEERGAAPKGLPQPQIAEGVEIDLTGAVVTDGWTDADFEKEWEKYKDLPLRDRRSGDERRFMADRRTGPEAERKDRRSKKDRRIADLFAERDEFLDKLERHKKNKEQNERQKKGGGEAIPLPSLVTAPVGGVERMAPPPVIPVEGVAAPVRAGEGEAGAGGLRERAEEIQRVTERVFEGRGAPGGGPGAGGAAGGPEGGGIPQARAEEAQPEEPTPPPGAGEGVESASPIAPLGGGGEEGFEEPEEPKEEEKKPPVQEIRGVLELKPPEEEDAPFLTLTYDFSRIPDSFKLSQNYHTMEYVYYKYKPMLLKAQEFTRRKMLKSALNYYRVIKSQNIPPEFKRMINRNIEDISEYLEKFLMRKGG
jgi:hypothetical protein